MQSYRLADLKGKHTQDCWAADQTYEEMKYDFEDSFPSSAITQEVRVLYFTQFTSCLTVLPAQLGPCIRKN